MASDEREKKMNAEGRLKSYKDLLVLQKSIALVQDMITKLNLEKDIG